MHVRADRSHAGAGLGPDRPLARGGPRSPTTSIEAAIALASGAAADSIALVGFGPDSGIEVAAAVLLWRLALEARGTDGEELERAERRVHRFVGATFLALAVYVTGQAGWTLWTHEAPQESLVGIVLAAASLVIMPLVSWGKLRAAREIGRPSWIHGSSHDKTTVAGCVSTSDVNSSTGHDMVARRKTCLSFHITSSSCSCQVRPPSYVLNT